MNRKILLQVAAPIVLIGLLIFGACFIGVHDVVRVVWDVEQVVHVADHEVDVVDAAA